MDLCQNKTCNQLIYRKGLEECAKHFSAAIDNLRLNPRSPESLSRLKKLSEHYKNYCELADSKEDVTLQHHSFKPIAEKITALVKNKKLDEMQLKSLQT